MTPKHRNADEHDRDATSEPADSRMYTSAPLEDEDGDTYVIEQQNVGPGNEEGGGEWPDPDTPPAPESSGG